MAILTQAIIDEMSSEKLFILTEALANPVFRELIDHHIENTRKALLTLDTRNPETLQHEYRINKEMLQEWETFREVANSLIEALDLANHRLVEPELDLTIATNVAAAD